MKVVSIFFSAVLLFPILFFSLHILSLYDSKGSLKLFGFKNEDIAPLAMPSITWLTIYVAALLIAIFLNIKKRYVANTVFLGVMIIIYILLTRFVRFL